MREVRSVALSPRALLEPAPSQHVQGYLAQLARLLDGTSWKVPARRKAVRPTHDPWPRTDRGRLYRGTSLIRKRTPP